MLPFFYLVPHFSVVLQIKVLVTKIPFKNTKISYMYIVTVLPQILASLFLQVQNYLFPLFMRRWRKADMAPFLYMTSYFCESRTKRMMTSCRFHQHLTISFLIAKMFWQLFCAYSYCACNFWFRKLSKNCM